MTQVAEPKGRYEAVKYGKAEARAQMDAIIDAVEAGLDAFARAVEVSNALLTSGGYKLLGYRSMAGCLTAELGVSRRRGQQIFAQLRASELLSDAAGEPVVVTAREAKAVMAATRDGNPIERAASETPAQMVARITSGTTPRPLPDASLPIVRIGGGNSDWNEGIDGRFADDAPPEPSPIIALAVEIADLEDATITDEEWKREWETIEYAIQRLSRLSDRNG